VITLDATRVKYGEILSGPTDLFTFRELIILITSFIRGGSVKIEGTTLFERCFFMTAFH